MAAGIGATFNPFADDNSFLVGAFVFEDVGVTAYHGAATLAFEQDLPHRCRRHPRRRGLSCRGDSHPDLWHVRQLGLAPISTTPTRSPPCAPRSAAATKRPSAPPPSLPADTTNSIAFDRTTDQVLHIVYAAGRGSRQQRRLLPQRIERQHHNAPLHKDGDRHMETAETQELDAIIADRRRLLTLGGSGARRPGPRRVPAKPSRKPPSPILTSSTSPSTSNISRPSTTPRPPPEPRSPHAGVPSQRNRRRRRTVTVKPNPKVPFTDPTIASYAMETATEERKHVALPAERPGQLRRRHAQHRSAQQLQRTRRRPPDSVPAFDPFASELNFLLGAFIFEDVGVTAYHGAAALHLQPAYLDAAAGIMAVEAYHAGLIRTVLYGMDAANPAAGINAIASKSPPPAPHSTAPATTTSASARNRSPSTPRHPATPPPPSSTRTATASPSPAPPPRCSPSSMPEAPAAEDSSPPASTATSSNPLHNHSRWEPPLPAFSFAS